MPRAIGDCKEFTERWYYDEADEECRAFLYGGCGGNANNFESLTACRSRCQTDPSTSLAPEDTSPVEQDFRTGKIILKWDYFLNQNLQYFVNLFF